MEWEQWLEVYAPVPLLSRRACDDIRRGNPDRRVLFRFPTFARVARCLPAGHSPTLRFKSHYTSHMSAYPPNDRTGGAPGTPDRRTFLRQATILVGLVTVGRSAMAQPRPRAATAAGPSAAAQPAVRAMTVYKDPSCGCCSKWVDHVKQAGFTVTVLETSDMDGVKTSLGVPAALASCHTARVGAYSIEGHVPADLIVRLLKERPVARGLAVPGMPVGSPGMEMGSQKDPYDVLLFDKAGKTKVYASR